MRLNAFFDDAVPNGILAAAFDAALAAPEDCRAHCFKGYLDGYKGRPFLDGLSEVPGFMPVIPGRWRSAQAAAYRDGYQQGHLMGITRN